MNMEEVRKKVQHRTNASDVRCSNCAYRNDLLADRQRGTYCERWHYYFSEYDICRFWRSST